MLLLDSGANPDVADSEGWYVLVLYSVLLLMML